MYERASDAARAIILWAADLVGAVRSSITRWVYSGDSTLVVILVAVALLLLLTIVVPHRRRY
jgi:hypothetical protein